MCHERNQKSRFAFRILNTRSIHGTREVLRVYDAWHLGKQYTCTCDRCSTIWFCSHVSLYFSLSVRSSTVFIVWFQWSISWRVPLSFGSADFSCVGPIGGTFQFHTGDSVFQRFLAYYSSCFCILVVGSTFCSHLLVSHSFLVWHIHTAKSSCRIASFARDSTASSSWCCHLRAFLLTLLI